MQESSRLNVAFTLVEVCGLLIFIFLGIQAPGFGRHVSAPVSVGFLPASALIIFAYLGFENLVKQLDLLSVDYYFHCSSSFIPYIYLKCLPFPYHSILQPTG